MKHNGKSIFYNWQIKILCFIAAVFVYIFVSFGIQERREITLPLNVILPEGYTATSYIPKNVVLVLSGSEDVIYIPDAGNYTLTADFSNVSSEGVSSVVIKINDSGLSSYVNLDSVSVYTKPSYLKVYFEKSADGQN